jgi:hypothetical protein
MVRLLSLYYNIELVTWPWEGTQTAMLRHCNIRLRDECEWIYHIDVDELLVLGQGMTSLAQFYDTLPSNASGIQFKLYTFYPSGHVEAAPPSQIKSYDCRSQFVYYIPKSAVKPKHLHPSWWHTVHFFCYADGAVAYHVPAGFVHLNHYKVTFFD